MKRWAKIMFILVNKGLLRYNNNKKTFRKQNVNTFSNKYCLTFKTHKAIVY